MKLKLLAILHVLLLLPIFVQAQEHVDLDSRFRQIDEAIAECGRLGIHGKATTPYLLDKIQKLTGGKSLEANIQLVYNNVAVGAEVAKALCAMA